MKNWTFMSDGFQGYFSCKSFILYLKQPMRSVIQPDCCRDQSGCRTSPLSGSACWAKKNRNWFGRDLVMQENPWQQTRRLFTSSTSVSRMPWNKINGTHCGQSQTSSEKDRTELSKKGPGWWSLFQIPWKKRESGFGDDVTGEGYYAELSCLKFSTKTREKFQ